MSYVVIRPQWANHYDNCFYAVDKADWDHPLFDVYEDIGREKPGKDKDFTVGEFISVKTYCNSSI